VVFTTGFFSSTFSGAAGACDFVLEVPRAPETEPEREALEGALDDDFEPAPLGAGDLDWEALVAIVIN